MLDEDFKIYCLQNLRLAKSIVFKSEFDVTSTNNYLESLGETIDKTDPTTWKYYKNLAGEYYTSNSIVPGLGDKMMTVLSVEDGTMINFDKATLATHNLTKLSFDEYVDELVAANPTQEALIYSIINPIDINTAIAAEDLTILYYDKSLVGENESSLINKIQQWMRNFKDRWFKQDFQLSDPKYMHTFYTTMMLNLVPAIMNFRLEACGTPEVAEYHLWSFLGDHYELDKYRDSLSRKQALWLYRNMVDIQRNAGKEWVLDSLIEHLAVPKGLQATKFDFVRQDSESLLNGRGAGSFLERDIGDDTIRYGDQSLVEGDVMLFKTRDKAVSNRNELANDESDLEYKMYYENTEQIPTSYIEFNLLESSILSAISDTKEKIENWLYLSAIGRYTGFGTFEIPNSGSVTLTAKDAFILYEYARKARNGIELVEVEPLVARGVVTYEPITVDTFRPYYEPGALSDDYINEALADRIPPVGTVSNADGLDTFVDYIRERKLKHRFQIDRSPTPEHYMYADQIVNGMWDDYTCVLAPEGTTYNDWLSSKKINKFSISNADWNQIMLDLLFHFTGIDPNNIGIGVSKRAMIDIIDRLTSYDLIITDGVGSGEINELKWPVYRPTPAYGSKTAKYWSKIDLIRMGDLKLERGSKTATFTHSFLQVKNDRAYKTESVHAHDFTMPMVDASNRSSEFIGATASFVLVDNT